MTSTSKQPLKILYAMPPGIIGDPTEDFPVEVPVEWINFADLADGEFDSISHEIDAVMGLPGGVVKNEIIEKTTGLRAVLSFAVGYEKIDRSMIPSGCDYVITLEHQYSIADWVMMAVLMMSRDAIGIDREFRGGTITTLNSRGGLLPDLFGSTLAVIGLGRIGKRVVQLARAHDMRCIAATRTIPDKASQAALGLDSVRGMSDLDEVLAEADHVVITIPLSDETTGLIGTQQYNAMKSTAYLINVSRGGLLDESATFQALKSGTIAGAALDVWWQNDKFGGDGSDSRWSSEPFWELDNVIMSPHWSSATDGMVRRKFVAMTAQINRLYNGEPLENSIPELSRVNEV